MQARLLKKREAGNSGTKLSFWKQKRRVLAAGVVALTVGAFGWDIAFNHSIAANHQRLYIGWSLPEKARTTPNVEQRILSRLDEKSKTREGKALVQTFAEVVKRRDLGVSVTIGDLLADLNESSSENEEQKWHLRAELGEIYVEQLSPDDAKNEFQRVLTAIPRSSSGRRKSSARESARYGLARAHMLEGAYKEALSELEFAPGEFNGGCGIGNTAEADDNYPLQVVWTAASKPLHEAEKELQPIMQGRFAPRKSDAPFPLNGDTSEEQRKHASAEAGLTLGCLYYQAGRFTEARACWDLVASSKNSQGESRLLADALLKRMASLSFDEG